MQECPFSPMVFYVGMVITLICVVILGKAYVAMGNRQRERKEQKDNKKINTQEKL